MIKNIPSKSLSIKIVYSVNFLLTDWVIQVCRYYNFSAILDGKLKYLIKTGSSLWKYYESWHDITPHNPV